MGETSEIVAKKLSAALWLLVVANQVGMTKAQDDEGEAMDQTLAYTSAMVGLILCYCSTASTGWRLGPGGGQRAKTLAACENRGQFGA